MKHLIAAACLVLGTPVASLAALPASAQTVSAQTVSKADMGLSVGAAIPEISGTTQTGAPATFDQLKGEKGLVLADPKDVAQVIKKRQLKANEDDIIESIEDY